MARGPRLRGVHPDTILHLYDDDELGVVRHSWSHRTATSLPYCDNPVWITMTGKRGRSDFRGAGDGGCVVYDQDAGGGTIALNMPVPCRRCPKCAFIRAKRYERRIRQVLKMAEDCNLRSYLVTLTFKQGYRAMLWNEACRRAGGPSPSVRDRGKPAVPYISEWVRRLRDQNKRLANVKLRYIAVVEYHQSGDPHVHLVLSGNLTTKTIRRAKWSKGFLHVRRIKSAVSHDHAALS